MKKAAWITGLIVLILSVIAGLIVGISLAMYANQRANCKRWAHNTGVPTKYVQTSWAWNYSCLARTKNGLWVPNNQWKVLVNGG